MAPAAAEVTQPLLDISNGTFPGADEDGRAAKPQHGVWAAEFRHILVLSAPAIVQLCTQQALVITNQVFAGRLGEEALGGASIGLTYFNLMFYFLLGVSSALDTLGSQAYGAEDVDGVISWAIAASSVMSGIAVVMGVGLWYTELVAVHLFRQPEIVARLAGTYCRWMIPGLIPFVFSLSMMKAMQAQNLMWPPAVATAMTSIANVGINLVLIRWYGFEGAAAAFSVTRALLFLLIAAYTAYCAARVYAAQKDVGKDDEEVSSVPVLLKAGLSLETQWAFMQLGIPGGFMMAAEASSYDVTTALAGTVQLDAHTAIMTLLEFLYISFPFGIATSATIRVGNLLGAGRPREARVAAVICIAIGTGFLAVAAVLILALRNSLGYLFVDSADVAAVVASICPIAAMYQIPDGVLGTIGGVLRGMGQQGKLGLYNFLGFWGFGVIVGYVLCFHVGWGLKGLWSGIVAGVFLTSTLCTIQLFRVDWQHEAAAAAAQQRTINSLEAGIVAGGDPELLLLAAEAEEVQEQGATAPVLLRDPTLRAYVRQRSLRQHVPVPVHHPRRRSGTSSPERHCLPATSGSAEGQPPAAGAAERLTSSRQHSGRSPGERSHLARSGSLVRRDNVSASFGHHR